MNEITRDEDNYEVPMKTQPDGISFYFLSETAAKAKWKSLHRDGWSLSYIAYDPCSDRYVLDAWR